MLNKEAWDKLPKAAKLTKIADALSGLSRIDSGTHELSGDWDQGRLVHEKTVLENTLLNWLKWEMQNNNDDSIRFMENL